jgi:hypothetical protein
MILALILAAATATASPAAPPAQPAQPGASAPDKKPAAEQMICRTETPIGTRFPKKVCHAASDIEVRGRTDRQDIEAAQKGYSGCGQLGTRC